MTESAVERVRRKRVELGLTSPKLNEDLSFDDDLIPNIGPSTFQRTPEDQDIDTLLDGVDILDAYNRWCGKSQPAAGSKRESVMVSCPNPGHEDKHPSAWLNLDKGVYTCAPCGFAGGDKYDIAAHRFGFTVPGYKRDGSFPELRRRMAEDLGYTVTKTATRTLVSPTVEDEQDSPEPPPAPIVSLVPAVKVDPVVKIDWRDIVPEDTFLWRWMEVCSEDDLPEEFYFWLGLMALGFAAGDDAVLRDNPHVKANLFVALYGPTGIGKSRAMRVLVELLIKALPYEHSDPNSKGISLIASPGSAEGLLDSFSKPIMDPTNPKVITGYGQVRGLLRIDELSDIMGRAARHGSVMKPMLMRFYDAYGDIDLHSRGAGYTKAANPYCSALTSSQPKAVRDLLAQTDADSGFVNRWVFAVGEPKKLIAIDREPLDIDSCVDLLRVLRAWSASGRQIKLDDGAKLAWSSFFESVIEPIKVSGEDSLLSRTDLTLKKMMLLFAINEKQSAVTAGIVERVLSLWPYLCYSYKALADEIGLGEFEDCRMAVLSFVAEYNETHGFGPTTRDMSRHLPKRLTRELVMKVMANLEQMGELVGELPVKKTAGRQSGARYRVAA